MPFQCRFGLFVKLKPGIVSYFPGQKRVWYYNGNKFTDQEDRMIKNLLNHVFQKMHLYSIIELYDNNFDKDSPDRLIFKKTDTIFPGGEVVRNIEVNRLQKYTALLTGYPLANVLNDVTR